MTKEQAIKTMVAWWADILRGLHVPKWDMGESGIMQELGRASMILSIERFPLEEVEGFEERLTDIVTRHLSNKESVYLSVDYHPQGDLAKALDGKADLFIFPCKTHTHLFKQDEEWKVILSNGYQAKLKFLEA